MIYTQLMLETSKNSFFNKVQNAHSMMDVWYGVTCLHLFLSFTVIFGDYLITLKMIKIILSRVLVK